MRFDGNTADMCQCAGCFEERMAVIKQQKRHALHTAIRMVKEREEQGIKVDANMTRNILRMVGFK